MTLPDRNRRADRRSEQGKGTWPAEPGPRTHLDRLLAKSLVPS